jgi:hypothetical protein
MARVARAGDLAYTRAMDIIARTPIDPYAPRTVSVTGSGTVRVAPDIATLRLGVAIQRLSIAEAQATAAETMRRVIDALAAAGIAAGDLRTTSLSVQPQYEYPRDGTPARLTGYQVQNVVSATVRDLGRVAETVDAALEAGATTLDGLSFDVADPSGAERDARAGAMADARAKAQELAAAADAVVVRVLSIAERGADAPVPLPRMMAARMMAADAAPTPIEAGTSEVEASVSVVYEIA